MKRYWKMISTVLVTVIVIGMFYFQASTAASNNPEFVIKKVSGSGNEGNKLSVFGEYITQGRHQDTVNIDEKETIYTSEISYIEGLNGVYHTAELKQLQRDYRNFMRGKELTTTSLYYEDEVYLAYSNIEWDYQEMDARPSNFSFNIEVLDKESKDVTVIKESMPNQNAYEYALVEDVQEINGKLKVVVRLSFAMEDNYEPFEEIHIYTFDINSETLIGDDIVASSGRSKKGENSNTWNQLSIFSDSENIQPQKYLLTKKVKVKEVQEGTESKTEETDQKFTLYNYETNEQKEVFTEKQQMDFENISIYGSTIYFINKTSNGLEILPYQIENGEFSKKQSIQIKISKEQGFPIIKLKNNRLYVVSPYKNLKTEAFILIADLKTWKTLYEGTIEITNLSENLEDYSLSINSLNIK